MKDPKVLMIIFLSVLVVILLTMVLLGTGSEDKISDPSDQMMGGGPSHLIVGALFWIILIAVFTGVAGSLVEDE